MNPKKLPDLDPKLKETYERVMGTSFPSPSQSMNQSVSSSKLPGSNPDSVQSNLEKTNHAKSKISPLLLFLLAVVFFAVYTLAWIRIFNISLPF